MAFKRIGSSIELPLYFICELQLSKGIPGGLTLCQLAVLHILILTA